MARKKKPGNVKQELKELWFVFRRKHNLKDRHYFRGKLDRGWTDWHSGEVARIAHGSIRYSFYSFEQLRSFLSGETP